MKPSHFTTPRTQADCQFAMNADPIEKLETHAGWGGRLAAATLVIALIGAAVAVAIRS